MVATVIKFHRALNFYNSSHNIISWNKKERVEKIKHLLFLNCLPKAAKRYSLEGSPRSNKGASSSRLSWIYSWLGWNHGGGAVRQRRFKIAFERPSDEGRRASQPAEFYALPFFLPSFLNLYSPRGGEEEKGCARGKICSTYASLLLLGFALNFWGGLIRVRD